MDVDSTHALLLLSVCCLVCTLEVVEGGAGEVVSAVQAVLVAVVAPLVCQQVGCTLV